VRRVRDLIRPLLRRAGLDVVRYDPTTFFASELREAGYGGRIVSFEPGPAAFARLESRNSGDSLWSCHRLVLGNRDDTATLNVSGNQ
jgi:FkbM family methyltransferase